MDRLNFILNGKTATANRGCTILEAALQNGVEIPTLCHDARLKPTAACRICLVSVAGARGPLPACATPLAEGMVIETGTEDLIKTRRMALELMLSDHYGDCVAPCRLACPAGIDIQGYIGLIANGMYSEALRLIMESNPLPMICGRVCPRFCEKQCRRNLVDSPVAINALKRFVSDYAYKNKIERTAEVRPPTGRKVAIIGGGPAGLTAAYYLALEGHSIAIFDANPELGGMMRYGIPAYRLPRDILNKEIADITVLCKEVHCNTAFGRDFDFESLHAAGYQAVLFAIGAQADQRMRIEGEDLKGVHSGIGFLREIALGNRVKLGMKVAVIGGGNTAIDAAQTAVRLGCPDVTIVYRRTRDEMPASEDEIKQAEDKGVKFCFLAAPLKVHSDNGRVKSLECISMQLGEPDGSGRRKPVTLPGSEFCMDVDNVIMAIGQSVDAPSADNLFTLDRKGCISINKLTMQASAEGVFAAGDCSTGPATVVEAVAAGKRAADSINRYLAGAAVEPDTKPYSCSKGQLADIDPKEYSGIQQIPRVEMPTQDPGIKAGFDEYELGFSENMAQIEAGRCLACGCQKAFDCTLRDLGTAYGVDERKYAGLRHKRPVDEHEHPYILRDTNKCILCGRCVRICSEVVGLGALGFVNRGFETVVEPALGLQLQQTNCNSCGLCITACPTGAILPKVNLPKPGPWKLESATTTCPGCGTGCSIELNFKGNKLVKVSPPGQASAYLCEKGIFNQLSINGIKRATTPLIKKDGRLVAVGWEEAFQKASRGLLLAKNSTGGSSLAMLASPQLTNEEGFLVQKIARAALATNNIGGPSLTPINQGFHKYLGGDRSTCQYADLKNADLIVSYNCELEQKYPVIALMVRQAISGGSKLVSLSARQGAIDLMAGISLRVNRRTSVDVLNAILSYLVTYNMVDLDFISRRLCGHKELLAELKQQPLTRLCDIAWVNPAKLVEIAQLYARASRPVILVDGDSVTAREAAGISQLALITGNAGRKGVGILVLRSGCNTQGLLDMGLSPDFLPGQAPLDSMAAKGTLELIWQSFVPAVPGMSNEEIIEGVGGSIKGLLIIGNELVTSANAATFFKPGVFSVLIDGVALEKPPYPDVFFPASLFAENEGTYTSSEGRIMRLNTVFRPPAGRRNWEILVALSNALGYKMACDNLASISAEISRAVLVYRNGLEDGQVHHCFPQRFAACGI